MTMKVGGYVLATNKEHEGKDEKPVLGEHTVFVKWIRFVRLGDSTMAKQEATR